MEKELGRFVSRWKKIVKALFSEKIGWTQVA
jgi:hypothetical protein